MIITSLIIFKLTFVGGRKSMGILFKCDIIAFKETLKLKTWKETCLSCRNPRLVISSFWYPFQISKRHFSKQADYLECFDFFENSCCNHTLDTLTIITFWLFLVFTKHHFLYVRRKEKVKEKDYLLYYKRGHSNLIGVKVVIYQH